MATTHALTIIGRFCIKDCDSDYLHNDLRHLVAVGSKEALEREAKRWEETHNAITEAEEALRETLPDEERSPDYQEASDAYDKASPHSHILGSFVASLFWNSWAHQFYDFRYEIREVPVLE